MTPIPSPAADPLPEPAFTFVLVHGAWHGGWCWARVAERLRARGHRVLTPTLTGLGERAHLMSTSITLDTFVTDVGNVIDCEELFDVVLVGHSFGGSALSGVADRMPERLRCLVYLDAMLVEPGATVFDAMNPDEVAARIRCAEASSGGISLPAPPPEAFGVTDPQDADWLRRRLTPQPLASYASPLQIAAQIGNGLPCTYLACLAPAYPALAPSRERARKTSGMRYVEMATAHDVMVTEPERLADVLVETARDPAARIASDACA